MQINALYYQKTTFSLGNFRVNDWNRKRERNLSQSIIYLLPNTIQERYQ